MKEGKPGISFGRYGDSPERNGIPAKSFAIVATDDMTLEEGMAKYEPKEVDITIAVDDTLCKGVESWAWYGLQPVNKLLKPGGTLIVTSREEPATVVAMSHIARNIRRTSSSIVKGTVSFSGLWVYKEDHTDVRILGAISRILPELFSLKSVQKVILDEWKDPVKSQSAAKAHERTTSITVTPDQGQSRGFRTNSICPNGMKWAKASPFPAIPAGRTAWKIRSPIRWEDSNRIAIRRSRSTRPARCVRCWNFDTCIEVHALLAALPGFLLRRHAREFVRPEHASLLRMRRVRGGMPREGLRHHGERGGIQR